MRIGIITGEYPPQQGGVGAYSRIMAQTFTALGHTAFILSNSSANEDDPDIELTNPIKHWGITSLRRIKQWVRVNHLDVVNLQYQTAAYSMSPWIHFLPDYLENIPFVTTFHDLLFPYLFPKAGRLRDWIVMHLARSSTGVIATNQEDVLRIKHLPHAALIPIGSNILTPLPDDYDKTIWREKVGASQNDFLIAHFGFMNRSKGIETLLDALAILRNEGNPVKLVMIGGRTGSSDPTNAAYADEIDALIADYRLDPHICWTGFVDDSSVTAYLKACDAVVLPFRDGASYRRGSLMAAIQHHCAIITTQPQVAIPSFKDRENMLLFPRDDAHALADALKQIQQNPAFQVKLSEGAQELNQKFNWENIAKDQLALFEKLIGI